jgi:hypothetical protein
MRRWRLRGWKRTLDVAGLKDPSDSGGHDSEEEGDEDEEEEEEEEGLNEGEDGHDDGVGPYDEGVGVTGLLQDPHLHADLGLATSFTLL